MSELSLPKVTVCNGRNHQRNTSKITATRLVNFKVCWAYLSLKLSLISKRLFSLMNLRCSLLAIRVWNFHSIQFSILDGETFILHSICSVFFCEKSTIKGTHNYEIIGTYEITATGLANFKMGWEYLSLKLSLISKRRRFPWYIWGIHHKQFESGKSTRFNSVFLMGKLYSSFYLFRPFV